MQMRVIAVDTETVRNERPWSIQIAHESAPHGEIYYTDNPYEVAEVRRVLQAPNSLTVLHNAKYDLRVLGGLEIYPADTVCTMQMAYLLGEPALSLKVLAYRYAGIDMRTYREVTWQATQDKSARYLQDIIDREWPDPEPTVETKKDGSTHIKFPKNIRGKAKRLLDKYITDPSIDLHDKWNRMDYEGGRGQVEKEFGKMEVAFLDEVERTEAEAYALLDAEATYAIYPILQARIEELGLGDTLARDMATLPMVMAMEDNGIGLDRQVLYDLSAELSELIDNVIADVQYLTGDYVNPNSSQQVAELLYIMGIYDEPDMSTDASTLDQFREHTVVKKIQEYRAHTKLKSTYADKLGRMVDKDGRIHTRLSTTGTETGRLASRNPNLQNIPVRTELGRKIRKAFVAERIANG